MYTCIQLKSDSIGRQQNFCVCQLSSIKESWQPQNLMFANLLLLENEVGNVRLPYFFGCKTEVFLFQNNPKDGSKSL